MLIFGHTNAYWKEKHGGTVLFFLALLVMIVWIKPEYNTFKDLIKEFPSIGMCVFGFLLTFLGIILQGNSPTIELMKSNTKLYHSFITKNKFVVILSLVLSMYSYFIGYLSFEKNNFSCLGENLGHFLINNWEFIRMLTVSIFISAFMKYTYDVCVFIKLFYLLLKNN